MLRYSYVFRGEVASKKNSRMLVHAKGRSFLLPSERYREAKSVISLYGRPATPFKAARLSIRIYHGDAVRRDTNNATQGIQDVLVEMGVIEDDNWMVIGTPEVSHFIDVADPRMEVDVLETEPVDYREAFKAARKALKR
jgi:Holliday junction resolvase RusA-like endonuclease